MKLLLLNRNGDPRGSPPPRVPDNNNAKGRGEHCRPGLGGANRRRTVEPPASRKLYFGVPGVVASGRWQSPTTSHALVRARFQKGEIQADSWSQMFSECEVLTA